MTVNTADVATVGRAIYHKKILPTLGPEDGNKLVVIDVNSGDYEIDADDMAAVTRLLERRPDAYTWLERVGHPAAYHMGSLLPSQKNLRRRETT